MRARRRRLSCGSTDGPFVCSFLPLGAFLQAMIAYEPSCPSELHTAAYPHESEFLQLHSFRPSSCSLPPTPSGSSSPSPRIQQDLEVLCTLFADAFTRSELGTLPKTIRITFASLPLATKVAQAPPGSIARSDEDDNAQHLVLRCKIPTSQQVQQSGTVIEQDGKVALYCELVATTDDGDSVVDRVWFGDFDFDAGADREIAPQRTSGSSYKSDARL